MIPGYEGYVGYGSPGNARHVENASIPGTWVRRVRQICDFFKYPGTFGMSSTAPLEIPEYVGYSSYQHTQVNWVRRVWPIPDINTWVCRVYRV